MSVRPDRAERIAKLAAFLDSRATVKGFHLARMSRVEFGIVDPDRACFLGLHFQVDILETAGGASTLHLATEESLALLQQYGHASNLEGKLCWVELHDGVVSFVRLEGARFEKVQ